MGSEVCGVPFFRPPNSILGQASSEVVSVHIVRLVDRVLLDDFVSLIRCIRNDSGDLNRIERDHLGLRFDVGHRCRIYERRLDRRRGSVFPARPARYETLSNSSVRCLDEGGILNGSPEFLDGLIDQANGHQLNAEVVAYGEIIVRNVVSQPGTESPEHPAGCVQPVRRWFTRSGCRSRWRDRLESALAARRLELSGYESRQIYGFADCRALFRVGAGSLRSSGLCLALRFKLLDLANECRYVTAPREPCVMHDLDLAGRLCCVAAALKRIGVGEPDLLVARFRNEFIHGLSGLNQTPRFDGASHKDHAVTTTLGKQPGARVKSTQLSINRVPIGGDSQGLVA